MRRTHRLAACKVGSQGRISSQVTGETEIGGKTDFLLGKAEKHRLKSLWLHVGTAKLFVFLSAVSSDRTGM